MLKSEFESGSSLSRQTAIPARKTKETQDAPLHQPDPLARAISIPGGSPSADTHASLLNRATDHRPSRAAPSLLQLQRQYGNRYVQRVVARARNSNGEIAPEVEQAIEGARGSGHALDSGTRVPMESAFGTDFGGVKVHTDSRADSLNRALSARAFTTGQDIFFSQGEYHPGNSSGRELLAHELTHVVQQSQIPIQRKLTLGGPGDQYEQEADYTAKQVMTAISSPTLQRKCSCGGTSSSSSGECEACRKKRTDISENLPSLKESGYSSTTLGNLLHLFDVSLRNRPYQVTETSQDIIDTEPDIEYLYANGTTTCTFPGGTPSTTISNTECSRPCTVRHEGIHSADISPCCANAGTAYRAATTDAQRSAIRSSFFTWMSSNRNWFECRAYAESVLCADEMIASKNCSSPAPADAECCNHLASYRADKESRRTSNCNSAAADLTPCPSFSAAP
ncbi:hypothetical protein MYXO_03228 [Myxococcaceae bacterium]|nr:hypothetical protein MYXO_03228 [Myxococcaceae bacterium]